MMSVMTEADWPADYRAALTEAALFDTSAAGKLLLTGADAPMFLGNLSTNDIKNLPLGGGCAAYFCDSRAKVQFQAWIYHVRLADEQHAMWIETTSGRNAALAKYLDRYLISERVEITDVTEAYAQWHLAGPHAARVLGQALDPPLPTLPEFGHLERILGSRASCSIRQRELLGQPGFDLVCRKELEAEVRDRIYSTGVVLGTPETFETLRIEAGTPLFGQDIDENRFVMEVARALRAVSYTKGCYLGQEPIVMARDRAGHVNRAFLGVKVLEGGVLPAGTKLMRNADEVGLITSSVISPRLQAPIALGYIRRGHQDVGLRLEAATAEGKRAVEVLPFPPIVAFRSAKEREGS